MKNQKTQTNKLFSIEIKASQYNYSGYPNSEDWDTSNRVKMIIAGNDTNLKELLDGFEKSLSNVKYHIRNKGNDQDYDKEFGASYRVKVMEINGKAHEKFLSGLKKPLVLYKEVVDEDSADDDRCYEYTDIADIKNITKKDIKILSILEDTDDSVTVIINECQSSAAEDEE